MAAIQTRGTRLGAFLKKEFWTEELYCRAEADIITVTGLTKVDIGQVVYRPVAGTGKWVVVPAASVIATTAEFGIIIDDEARDKTPVANDIESTVILTNGPAVVMDGLVERVAGINATNAAVINDYFADKGIKLRTTLSFSQS